MFGGLRIFENDRLVERIGSWIALPKYSRHRSRRLLKKLMRRARYGAVDMMEPVAYQIGNDLHCHPTIAAELRRQVRRAPAPPHFYGLGLASPGSGIVNVAVP